MGQRILGGAAAERTAGKEADHVGGHQRVGDLAGAPGFAARFKMRCAGGVQVDDATVVQRADARDAADRRGDLESDQFHVASFVWLARQTASWRISLRSRRAKISSCDWPV